MTHRTKGSLFIQQHTIVTAHYKLRKKKSRDAELAKINILSEKNLNSVVLNLDSTEELAGSI